VYVFDHPEDEPQWDQDWRKVTWDGSSVTTVAYLTHLFENAGEVLRPFSDAQVSNGLAFLFRSEHIHAFQDDSPRQGASWLDRKRGLRSLYTLFEQCFALRCSPHLSHLDEPGANPLNVSCYMWWDIYPAYPTSANNIEEDEILLGVMEDVLRLDSDACRESALHGLGHWQMGYPERVKAVTDEFLARNQAIRPELKHYALQARRGQVL